jgi:peptide/nickel transport system permease protein
LIYFIARRLAATLPVLLIVAVLVFLLLRLAPGDPAAILAGDAASTEQIARIRAELGLDRPILVQFGIWLGNMASGELGESFFYKMKVSALIGQRLEPTLGARHDHDPVRGRPFRCRWACSPRGVSAAGSIAH